MLYLLLVILLILGERIIKNKMDQRREGDTLILKEKIIIRRYRNKGVALNFLQENVKLVKIITGCLIGGLGIVFLCILRKKECGLYKLGMAMMLGGAISNFSDRIERGYVVDYFSFNFGKKFNKIVFNLADVFVVIGGLIIVIANICKGHK